jgi:hypothetical protein
LPTTQRRVLDVQDQVAEPHGTDFTGTRRRSEQDRGQREVPFWPHLTAVGVRRAGSGEHAGDVVVSLDVSGQRPLECRALERGHRHRVRCEHALVDQVGTELGERSMDA